MVVCRALLQSAPMKKGQWSVVLATVVRGRPRVGRKGAIRHALWKFVCKILKPRAGAII
jgi:hypothetical protein